MGISSQLREAKENLIWESIFTEAFERALRDKKVIPFASSKAIREAATHAAKTALTVLRAHDALLR